MEIDAGVEGRLFANASASNEDSRGSWHPVRKRGDGGRLRGTSLYAAVFSSYDPVPCLVSLRTLNKRDDGGRLRGMCSLYDNVSSLCIDVPSLYDDVPCLVVRRPRYRRMVRKSHK